MYQDFNLVVLLSWVYFIFSFYFYIFLKYLKGINFSGNLFSGIPKIRHEI